MTFPAPTATHPCPKCAVPMTTFERSGIHVERCPECRGVFLDRGELDRLIDLESGAGGPMRGDDLRPRAGVAADPRWAAGGRDPRRDDPRDGRGYGRDDWDDDDDDDRGGRGRRGGFLADIFGGLGD